MQWSRRKKVLSPKPSLVSGYTRRSLQATEATEEVRLEDRDVPQAHRRVPDRTLYCLPEREPLGKILVPNDIVARLELGAGLPICISSVRVPYVHG